MERKIKQFEEDAVIHDETLQMMSDSLDKCQRILKISGHL